MHAHVAQTRFGLKRGLGSMSTIQTPNLHQMGQLIVRLALFHHEVALAAGTDRVVGWGVCHAHTVDCIRKR